MIKGSGSLTNGSGSGFGSATLRIISQCERSRQCSNTHRKGRVINIIVSSFVACSKYRHLILPTCVISLYQYCGAGAESRRAEIKLPPRAGAEMTNCGSGFFQFIKDLKKFYRKIIVANEVFVNYYNFNPI
jgi:hypothetical protein